MKKIGCLLWLTLLLAGGCASPPFAPMPATPTRPLSAAELLENLWTGGERVWRIRQTVLFEIRGAKVPMSGFLRFDTGRREARLIGLNDLGVKLFDIAVTPQTHVEHFLFPELARTPGVSGAIAAAVRHVFLDPQPLVTDRLAIGATEYRLTRREKERVLLFVFGGPDAQLLEKQAQGDEEEWRVRYFDYQPAAETPAPGGILLEDARGGYRLTLWLEEARVTDE
ncbi:MAG: hypothetical protein WCY68_01930 [Desulfuromonadales bacterium]